MLARKRKTLLDLCVSSQRRNMFTPVFKAYLKVKKKKVDFIFVI